MNNWSKYYIPQRKGELLTYLLRIYPDFKGKRMKVKQLRAIYMKVRDKNG